MNTKLRKKAKNNSEKVMNEFDESCSSRKNYGKNKKSQRYY